MFFEWIFFGIGLSQLISFMFVIKNIIDSLRAKKNLADYGIGSWALVTACTDGIGQGFAEVLAKKGFNIVQVGRNIEKLSSTGNDLKSKYGVQVKNIVKDFSLGTKNLLEFYEDLFNQTQDLDISIIVNNVGTGSGVIKFANTELYKILNVLALNIFPISFISRLYLPNLLKRPQGGAIINLSSVASICPAARRAIYASTKAFDYNISEILTTEISMIEKKGNVDVLCSMPGFVDTPLTKTIKSKPLQINRIECAEGTLKCLSFVNHTAGHWKHLIVCFVSPVAMKFGI